jgi:prephenate dehydrogenase
MNRPSQDPPPFAESVAIVGVGLIGGSIAAGLKRRGFTGPIVGVGRDPSRMEQARSRGLVDRVADVPALVDADLIVFCTPVDLIADGIRAAAGRCRPGTLLTDAGSVKHSICRALDGGLPEGVTFIGSHPLAGSEKHGFEYADADLFVNRVCVLTPEPRTPGEALRRLRAFWEFLGMELVELPADEHDGAVARTSHLPHVVAAALAGIVSPELYRLAGSGFRDTTRIAAGSPELWVGILLENADSLLPALDTYAGQLQEFRKAIDRRDAIRLRELLDEARRNRDALTN